MAPVLDARPPFLHSTNALAVLDHIPHSRGQRPKLLAVPVFLRRDLVHMLKQALCVRVHGPAAVPILDARDIERMRLQPRHTILARFPSRAQSHV